MIRAVLRCVFAWLVATLVAFLAIPTPEERPTVSVEEAGEWLGLGRSSAYEAVRRGEIPALKFNRSIRVPTAALRRMLGIDQEPATEIDEATVIPLRPERPTG